MPASPPFHVLAGRARLSTTNRGEIKREAAPPFRCRSGQIGSNNRRGRGGDRHAVWPQGASSRGRSCRSGERTGRDPIQSSPGPRPIRSLRAGCDGNRSIRRTPPAGRTRAVPARPGASSSSLSLWRVARDIATPKPRPARTARRRSEERGGAGRFAGRGEGAGKGHVARPLFPDQTRLPGPVVRGLLRYRRPVRPS
jgi:hypothetical protein